MYTKIKNNILTFKTTYTYDYVVRFWVFFYALLVFRLIYCIFPNLVPQEAYYWLYAKNLDFSYFDHPPMTAWTIAFFTYLGKDTPFFIRLSAILYSCGTMIIIFYLAKIYFRQTSLAYWTIVVMNSVIIFGIGAVIVTPDSPLIFFWSLVVFAIYKVIDTDKWWWWYVAGVALGFSFLSKYTAGLLVGCTFLFLLLSSKYRKWLLSIHPYIALCLSFAIFSPVIIWNKNHEWASFVFQSTRRVGMMTNFKPAHFFELIGSQSLMLTPLVFIGLIYALYQLIKRWWLYRNDRELFLLAYSVPVIILFSFVSFRTLVKMNWLAPAYITGLLATVLIFSEKQREFPHLWQRWIRSAINFAVALTLLMHLLPVFTFIPIGSGDTWSGWPHLASKVESMIQKDPHLFIFSPDYKISSELSFYLKDHPVTYSRNIFGQKALQFDYWNHPDELIGCDGLLISSNSMKLKKKDRELVEKYFLYVEEVDTLRIVQNRLILREFYFLKCNDYKGLGDVVPTD